MTQEEKRRIGEMRAAGCSYIRIAAELNISVNSIKSYCRRHSLGAGTILQEAQAVQETHVLPELAGPALQEMTSCEQCGSPVHQIAGRKHRRFCSEPCRLAWWAAHRSEMKRKAMQHFVCEHCGMQFSRYGVADRRFCSKSCAAQARRRREAGHDA